MKIWVQIIHYNFFLNCYIIIFTVTCCSRYEYYDYMSFMLDESCDANLIA